MMTLSWNEIRDRALKFSREWATAEREDAEAKSFWDAFFEVFGKARRTVAAFEDPVRNLKGQYGFIDLLWRGVLVVEHKSRGKDLAKAHTQAVNYIQDLEREGRGIEVPRYLLVSDFARFALYDLEGGTTDEFPLADLGTLRIRTASLTPQKVRRRRRIGNGRRRGDAALGRRGGTGTPRGKGARGEAAGPSSGGPSAPRQDFCLRMNGGVWNSS